MLGGASEAAFEVLWSTLKSKYNRKERFERLDNKPLKTKFDEVIKELELIKNKLPKEIKENIDTNIKGIFTLIRTQRNDFGHPTGKYINRFRCSPICNCSQDIVKLFTILIVILKMS